MHFIARLTGVNASASKSLEIVNAGIHQMRGRYPLHAHEDVVDPAGTLSIPLSNERLELRTFLVFSGAAKPFSDQWVVSDFGHFFSFVFSDVGKRSNDDMAAIVASQNGRHAFKTPSVEDIEEKGAHDVVHVVTECNLRAAKLVGNAIENATAQSRAKGTDILAVRNQSLDDRVGVLILNVVRHPAVFQVRPQRLNGELRDMLMDVDGDEREVDWSSCLERFQRLKQYEAVLAAAHGDKDFVSILDHAEVGDSFSRELDDPLGETAL